jgi:hypothetical protein
MLRIIKFTLPLTLCFTIALGFSSNAIAEDPTAPAAAPDPNAAAAAPAPQTAPAPDPNAAQAPPAAPDPNGQAAQQAPAPTDTAPPAAPDAQAAPAGGFGSAPAIPTDSAGAAGSAAPGTADANPASTLPAAANPAASTPSSLSSVANPAATAGFGSAPDAGIAAVDDSPSEKSEDMMQTVKEKQQGIARLVKKLSPGKGKTATIVLLRPIDYTTMDFADLASFTLEKTLQKYGKFNIQNKTFSMKGLTLEEFRKIVARTQADVVMVTVLKPTNFDMFMYDRKTPYYIYAHSEVLPEANQYKLTKDIVADYMKILIRRTLFGYLQDQYYELPRDEAPQVLKSEIPRWIASNDNLTIVNRDIVSNLYASVGFGTSVAMGGAGSWTSNLLSLEVGMRATDTLFGELGFDAFSYNALSGVLKYGFISRDSPFRFYLGGGLAYAFNAHTLNFDQLHTQGLGNAYVEGVGEICFPIIDIYFKLEGKLLYGMGSGSMVFSVIPGLMLLF